MDNVGRVIQVMGPVVDARFEAGQIPDLYNSIIIPGEDYETEEGEDLVLEVAQHLGSNVVRCIAMDSTDGVRRGMRAVDSGNPISVPVGRETLGRMFNLLGDPIDDLPALEVERHPIHRPAPSVEEVSATKDILETGIKVIDLICPFTRGGKVGLMGGAGVGKTVLIQELIHNVA